jgi:hypothetical protein
MGLDAIIKKALKNSRTRELENQAIEASGSQRQRAYAVAVALAQAKSLATGDAMTSIRSRDSLLISEELHPAATLSWPG